MSGKLSKSEAKRQLDRERASRLAELRDESLGDALAVVSSTMAFREIDPMDQYPPREWEERYGPVEAARRFAVARAAWMPAKDAPAAIKLAFDLVRAASHDASATSHAPQLNVAIRVTQTSDKSPGEMYEVIDVDPEE